MSVNMQSLLQGMLLQARNLAEQTARSHYQVVFDKPFQSQSGLVMACQKACGLLPGTSSGDLIANPPMPEHTPE